MFRRFGNLSPPFFNIGFFSPRSLRLLFTLLFTFALGLL